MTVATHDAIERAAYTDWFAAAPQPLLDELDLEAVAIGPAFVMSSGRSANPLFNRAIGASAGQLRELAAHFGERAVEQFFIHLYESERSPSLEREVRELGLERYPRSWAKLVRDDEPFDEVGESPVVREPVADEVAGAAAIYCAAFDQPAELAPFIACTFGRRGWEWVVGCDGDEVVSVGLAFHRDGEMYLAGGATRPSHRRRGYQSALLRARVRLALERGCRRVCTETGEAAPGDPQHSYRNMLGLGFSPVAIRDNYAPRGMRWGHGARARR